MSRSLLITCLLILFVLATNSAKAEESITISFKAVVKNISFPQYAKDVAEEGDIITGTFRYTAGLSSTLKFQSGNIFDLQRENYGFLEVSVNGKRYYSVNGDPSGLPKNLVLNARVLSTVAEGISPNPYGDVLEAFCRTIAVPNRTLADYADMRLRVIKTESEPYFVTSNLPLSFEADLNGASTFSLTLHKEDKFNQVFETQIEADVFSLEFNSVVGGWIEGNMFADVNENCAYGSEDMPLVHQLMVVHPGNNYVMSDRNGAFKAFLATNDYRVELANKRFWSLSCEPDEAISVLVVPDQTTALSVPVAHDTWGESADVSLAAGRPRPGFKLVYKILVSNTGGQPFNGELRFTYESLLAALLSSPTADITSPTEIVWRLNDVPVGFEREYSVTMRVPPDERLLGRQLCAWARIDKDDKGSDELLGNTVDEICQEIVGSHDPNDIQVFAETANADGPLLPEFRELNYVIRFQNEGTAEAVTVRVVDELSEFLNIGKLRIGACSHDFEFNFTGNNALEWTFNNINLPPKSEDEAASQGYIKFHIELNDDLPPGTEIANQAAIYFDFNKPVLTNTVVSRIGQTTTDVELEHSAADVSVFPNPAAQTLNIDLGDKQKGRQKAKFSIRNLLGQELLQGELNNQHNTIDLRALRNGMYFLTVRDPDGTQTLPINIAR